MGISAYGVKVFDGYVAPTFAMIGSIIPQSAKYAIVTTLGSQDLRADGVKTYLGRTGNLLKSCLEFTGNESKTLFNLGFYGSAIKASLSAIEVFTKFPEMCRALATKTEEKDSFTRRYHFGDGSSNRLQNQGFEIVSDRLTKVWFWLIGVADATSFASKVSPNSVPQLLQKAQPWLYIVGGGAVGLHFIQQEWKVLSNSTNTRKEELTSEKVRCYLNLVTSVAYLSSSAVMLIKQFSKAESLKKWSFYTSVGTGVLPVVQRLFDSYMDYSYSR